MGCVSTKEEGENEKSITRAKSVKMKEILTAALKKSSILKPIVERLSEAELIELVECFQMVVIKGGNYLFKVGTKTLIFTILIAIFMHKTYFILLNRNRRKNG